MLEEQIKDKLTKTCPCRQVTRATIKEAIKNGADTLEKVKARTGAMITLIVSQLIHVFECKSEEKTLFSVPFFSNPFMLFAVAVSIICLLLCIYIPFLSGVFALVRPGPTMWLVSVGFSFAVPIFSGIFSKLSI